MGIYTLTGSCPVSFISIRSVVPEVSWSVSECALAFKFYQLKNKNKIYIEYLVKLSIMLFFKNLDKSGVYKWIITEQYFEF